MKRIVLVAALIVALMISAVAYAATTTYSGSISSGTTTFKVIKKNGKRKLSKFQFHTVPIACDSGGETASGADSLDKFPIAGDGTFKLVLVVTDTATFDGKLVFKGTVTGATAKGTFHLSGKKVPIDANGGSTGRHCDTGLLHWTANAQ